MTAHRPPAVPRPAAAQPTAVTALGDALLARADDCTRLCQERRQALGIGVVGSAEFRDRRDAAQLLGVQLFARWLRTGELTTREERKWLGELGEHGARSGVSISDMTSVLWMTRNFDRHKELQRPRRNASTPSWWHPRRASATCSNQSLAASWCSLPTAS